MSRDPYSYVILNSTIQR